MNHFTLQKDSKLMEDNKNIRCYNNEIRIQQEGYKSNKKNKDSQVTHFGKLFYLIQKDYTLQLKCYDLIQK
jgi:hypothetical protein